MVGSAQLTTTGTVSGFAIFRYNPTGQEAVVPPETRNASAYVLAFDNTNGLATDWRWRMSRISRFLCWSSSGTIRGRTWVQRLLILLRAGTRHLF